MSVSAEAAGDSLLGRLESTLEHVVEGIFRRDARSRFQPVEIAGHLTRQAEAAKLISLNHVYVPNRYCVSVHPGDMQVLRTFAPEMEAEFSRYLADWVAEREYTVSGPVRVEIKPKEGVAPGKFLISPAWSDTPTDQEADEPTGVHARVVVGEPLGHLEAVEGPERGRVFPLSGDRVVMGRSSDCDLQFRDNLASRRHAALECRDGEWLLTDLGSTNGTRLNGDRVEGEILIHNGDMLRIGSSIFRLALLNSEPGSEMTSPLPAAAAQETELLAAWLATDEPEALDQTGAVSPSRALADEPLENAAELSDPEDDPALAGGPVQKSLG